MQTGFTRLVNSSMLKDDYDIAKDVKWARCVPCKKNAEDCQDSEGRERNMCKETWWNMKEWWERVEESERVKET